MLVLTDWFFEIYKACELVNNIEDDTDNRPAFFIVILVPRTASLSTVNASPRILAILSNLTIPVSVEPLALAPSKRNSLVGIVILELGLTDTCLREPCFTIVKLVALLPVEASPLV